MERKSVGAFIAALRKEKGMTQKQLAEKLNVTDKAVSRWEREESAPDLSLIPMISDVFGITADELLRGQRRPSAAPENAHRSEQIPPQIKPKHQIHTMISYGLVVMGLPVAFVCRFAIGYRYGILGYCLGLMFYLAAGICQAVFTISALAQPNIDNPLRDRIARTAINLFILLTTLSLGSIPVMNSSLDFWEILLVGALIGIPVGAGSIIACWYLVIPRLAEKSGLFLTEMNNEPLQNLRKETIMWSLWIVGIWILLSLTFSTISSSTYWLLIAGIVIISLTLPVSMIIYLIRKRNL